jgi:hypothetical protein
MKRHPSDSNVSYNSTICGCLRLEQILASRLKSKKDKKIILFIKMNMTEEFYHRQKILVLM